MTSEVYQLRTSLILMLTFSSVIGSLAVAEEKFCFTAADQMVDLRLRPEQLSPILSSTNDGLFVILARTKEFALIDNGLQRGWFPRRDLTVADEPCNPNRLIRNYNRSLFEDREEISLCEVTQNTHIFSKADTRSKRLLSDVKGMVARCFPSTNKDWTLIDVGGGGIVGLVIRQDYAKRAEQIGFELPFAYIPSSKVKPHTEYDEGYGD